MPLLSMPFLCVEHLMMLEAALEILSCLFLKETGCREETWLLRIKGDGDFLGNNIAWLFP